MHENFEPLGRPDRSARMLEVDFALVVSRLIEAAQHDPEQLRGAIYELARLKLVEQADGVSGQERQRVVEALEVAIQGVEQFSRKQPIRALLAPEVSKSRELSAAANQSAGAVRLENPVVDLRESRALPPVQSIARSQDISPAAVRVRVSRSRLIAATGVVVMVILLVGLTTTVFFLPRLGIRTAPIGELVNLLRNNRVAQDVALPIGAARWPKQLSAPQDTRSPLVPKTFGVFAISADQLFELEALPGRVPDVRVAISAAITSPSRISLSDGKVRFIVYRRDGPANTPDRAEVRVVAKVTSAMSFGSGKPTVTTTEDTWVIRNVTISYRVAPVLDEAEMYEIRNEESFTLSPGRYALVIKGVAYDFSVAGPIIDPMQCLERIEAANGSFYSPCQKL